MEKRMRDYTEICLKDAYGIYTVQQDKIGMNINDLIECLVKPVLNAAGYTQKNVDAVLYGAGDACCPYEPELEKILDALCCDNADQAIEKIDQVKSEIVGWHAQQNKSILELRSELGISGTAISIGEAIDTMKKKSDAYDKIKKSVLLT